MQWVRHLAQRGEVRVTYIIIIGGVIFRDSINPLKTNRVCVM